MTTPITTRPATSTPTRTWLSTRRWFTLDAVVTGANGLAYLALAGALGPLLGGSSVLYLTIGPFLVALSVGIGVFASGRGAGLAGRAIVAINTVWVLASVVVASTGALDLAPAGRAWALAQAAVVGALTVMQARSLPRDR